MIQVLCFTGRGFDTCWRPSNIAVRVVYCNPLEGNALYTPIRFFTGDFA